MTGHRVLLHVGTPKTGTSSLQDVLFRNRGALLDAGISYPADRFDEHFLAALDLMGLRWGGLQAEAVGAWDRLAGRVREHPGTSIISHEILATATRAQVERALDTLGVGADDGPELHVVLSVRDLVRQIPAEWQENLKHRRSFSYRRFLELVRDPERSTRLAQWFWGVQDIPAILDRWGAGLPPERVHLVTVPPPGGDPDLLWERLSRAFGLDGLDLDREHQRSNPSLGVPESTLLRGINRRVHGRLPSEHYRPLVRELLVHQTLAQRRGSPRLALPPELRGWVGDLERAWVAEVLERGYDVVGDVQDLVGSVSGDWADPDRPRPRGVAGASLAAIEALLLEDARLREDESRLHAELDETRRAIEHSHARRTYRAREKAVRSLEAGGAGQAVLRVYRRVRGRPPAPPADDLGG